MRAEPRSKPALTADTFARLADVEHDHESAIVGVVTRHGLGDSRVSAYGWLI
jgi:hypothetical protein